MTKEFENKVRNSINVDTKLYRYIMHEDNGSIHADIRRIKLDALDTAAALSLASDSNPDGWVVVKQLW